MWDAKRWLEQFEKASHEKDYERLHALRRDVFFDTVADVQKGYYLSSSGKQVLLKDDALRLEKSELYQQELQVERPREDRTTRIEVKELDTLKAAQLLSNPLVLNMANRHQPGGGVLDGAGAQEEYLFRVSNYFRFLYQFSDTGSSFMVPRREESYPLDRNYGGVYSPSVSVFRSTEQEGYAKLEQPFEVSCVAVAAISQPNLLSDHTEHYWLEDSFIEPTKRKIRTIFNIAILHNHTHLVLGAFGCGAFKNPPNHIALLFKEVLEEPLYKNQFSHILFAILDNHNSYRWFNPEGNLKPFQKVFEPYQGM
ncbi:TIGR02452 family protein [Sphaerochaeta globosa]|uniref:Microbial-type PARG catalytic domain-containing protein n=1 Tax=Sphaerochaeta globosa (strain ATCC BAA-1886 / DSM 22777 / Buddy) TaxID=158189 RepID=F0RT96_SPHGB|nr:TIGR02452 family protein [Sphaerochaeta globosa]ADY14396.1 Conserved hypothetical protein CHP02452 [Sphaerochaeta globosa str. Buddy]